MNSIKCPICGEGTLHEQIESKTYRFKGASITIDNIVYDVCDKCGEAFFKPEKSPHVDAILEEFYARTLGVLSPSEIKKARTTLGFTQKEFAKRLGVGEKNFAKYESGIMRPNKTTSDLIRILYARPEMLKYVSTEGLPEIERGATSL